ncbi:interferon gamma receptor 2-like [Hyperolius riggenbachi]|uniref:interferon gamma receptor 2-like n=1 Tax=Hyperolius riggenbachi TaxID=752182 RepID=UPI0035A2F749
MIGSKNFHYTCTVLNLPAPTNVHIQSYNLKHVLLWDPVEVENEAEPVKYTVQYQLARARQPDYLCVNITETQCVFTKLPHFWRLTLLVRAELGSRRSNWTRTPEFLGYKNTTIGPVTSLTVQPHSKMLVVDFAPPFSPIPENWNMNYLLRYWKENSEEKEETVHSGKTLYILRDLEPHTKYCMQVTASTDYVAGLESETVCAMTEQRERTIAQALFITAGIVVFAIMIAVFAVKYPVHKPVNTIKNWLKCPYRVPPHIQEFLDNPPPSTYPEDAELAYNEQCDHLSIVGLELHVDEEAITNHSQPEAEKT